MESLLSSTRRAGAGPLQAGQACRADIKRGEIYHRPDDSSYWGKPVPRSSWSEGNSTSLNTGIPALNQRSSSAILTTGMLPGDTTRAVNTTSAAVGERGERIRTLWHMESPSGRAITCALYQLSQGFELRAGEGDDDRLLFQRVETARAAEVFAATWLAAAETQGFRQLSAGDGPTLESAGTDDVPVMDARPLRCPSCLAQRGRAQAITTPPERPGTVLLSVMCEVCDHTWSVLTRPPWLTPEGA